MAYPGGVRALDGVSLVIDEDELLAIVGPSGSGKSTQLNVMSTLDRPTAGTVTIGGQDVAGLSDRQLSALRGRWLGSVFQQFHLTDGLTAVENVGTGLLYAGVSRRLRRTLATQALSRIGLAHRTGHLPHQLSGGERQRVSIARVLVNESPLVLADEPTGALDTANGALALSLLTRMTRKARPSRSSPTTGTSPADCPPGGDPRRPPRRGQRHSNGSSPMTDRPSPSCRRAPRSGCRAAPPGEGTGEAGFFSAGTAAWEPSSQSASRPGISWSSACWASAPVGCGRPCPRSASPR